MILALFLALAPPAVANPPSIQEIPGRVLHVEFPAGAVSGCVFVQRQVKEEVSSSTNDDGYYTPSSCFIMDPDVTSVDDDIWNMVMPYFEDHHIESASWLVWGVLEYPTKSGEPEFRPTNVLEVVR